MARERSEFSGAMLASTLLHAGVIAAALISWPWAKQLPLGSAVPINIVANAPVTDLAPAATVRLNELALNAQRVAWPMAQPVAFNGSAAFVGTEGLTLALPQAGTAVKPGSEKATGAKAAGKSGGQASPAPASPTPRPRPAATRPRPGCPPDRCGAFLWSVGWRGCCRQCARENRTGFTAKRLNGAGSASAQGTDGNLALCIR